MSALLASCARQNIGWWVSLCLSLRLVFQKDIYYIVPIDNNKFVDASFDDEHGHYIIKVADYKGMHCEV
jgi:hypothetical protein